MTRWKHWWDAIRPAPIVNALTIDQALEMVGAGPTASGQLVTESTAMRVSAVYACVSLIAGAVAGLPLHVYRRLPDGRERDAAHPLDGLLGARPSPWHTAPVFWETMTTALLLGGDMFAEIVRRGDVPIALLPLAPSRVKVTTDKAGALLYEIASPIDGRRQLLDAGAMFHVPGVGFDGRRGMSPIRHAARQGVGIALAADEYSARFFQNGARPDFAITMSGAPSPDQIASLRSSWGERYGGASKSHLPAILTGGMDVKQLTLSAEDTQLIETRRFQVADIARVFGVPPHMIGETEKQTSWGTGVEQMSIGFVKYTLQRHLAKIEAECNRKLLPAASDRYVEFSLEGVLRGDSKARADYYRAALGGSSGPGWMTPNEIRRLENLPPVAAGEALSGWSTDRGAAASV